MESWLYCLQLSIFSQDERGEGSSAILWWPVWKRLVADRK